MQGSFLRARYFDDEDQLSELPDVETVTRLWLKDVRKELTDQKRKASTIAEYETHLRRWQQFWEAGGTPAWTESQRATDCQSVALSLPEPDGKLVSSADLKTWRTWLETQGITGARNLNKHVGTISSILRASELSVPRVRHLPTRKAARKLYLSLDEAARIYEACEAAKWPTRDRRKHRLPRGPTGQWRAAFVLFCTYGFRTQELIQIQPQHEPLRWRQFWYELETPDADGRATNPHGWFWYTPQKQERVKPDPLFLPLSEIAAAHLASIRSVEALPDDPVFDWPRRGGRFYEEWERIIVAAGVRPKSLKPGDESAYQVKHLRKTCATWHDDNVPGSASLILGHAPRGETVTREHYINGEKKILQSVSTFPQPAPFEQIFQALKDPADPQRLLF